MLKFLIVVLVIAIYIAISYWLLSRRGFDTAREYAQYLMGEDTKHTVVYSIETILILPVIVAWCKIEFLFKKLFKK